MRKRIWLSVIVLAGVLAGCGAGVTPPNQVADTYVSTLAEGAYSSACAMLPAVQQAALARSGGPRSTCVAAFNRCVPKQATNSSQDQTQLYYANVQSQVSGSHAVVELSGTPVASAVQQVTLVQHAGVWDLTSYGVGLRKCVLATPRRATRERRKTR